MEYNFKFNFRGEKAYTRTNAAGMHIVVVFDKKGHIVERQFSNKENAMIYLYSIGFIRG